MLVINHAIARRHRCRHRPLAEPRLREEVLARIPQRAIGTVSDVVAAAAFFASDEASYCNGAAIPIDGGLVRG